jgi:hypothetical protein
VSAYPLATVLALRARAADAARADLARALDALDRRRAELARQDATVAACATRARAEEGGPGALPGGLADLAARARWAARLRAELEAQRTVRAAADRAAAAAARDADARREAVVAARGALRALELHREGWSAALARRRDRREQDAADDLVSARRAAP